MKEISLATLLINKNLNSSIIELSLTFVVFAMKNISTERYIRK